MLQITTIMMLVFMLCLPAWSASSRQQEQSITLFGEERGPSRVKLLHAGPLSMEFLEGELRHIRMGERQIIQRVYFAVRDSNWDTAMPVLTSVNVKGTSNSFNVSFKAKCSNTVAEYSWQGRIVGSSTGKITFTATGSPDKDFSSPRIGINVLFGTPELAGTKYELVDGEGITQPGQFPVNVHPGLITETFSSLAYKTADGMTVTTSLTGSHFWMEDQRQYGDASYKALGWHNYPYPNVKAGDEQTATLTIELTDAVEHVSAPSTPTTVMVSKTEDGGRMPAFSSSTNLESSVGAAFVTTLGKGAEHKQAKTLTWALCPVLHLWDDDTFIDNLPTVVDQVRTMHTLAPDAEISIDPITINSPYPRTGPDPRNKGLFGAMWVAGLTQYLAKARVDHATVAVQSQYIDELLRVLILQAGKPTLGVAVTGSKHELISAYAVKDQGSCLLCLVNLSPKAIAGVKVSGTEAVTLAEEARISSQFIPGKVPVSTRSLASNELWMRPYEILFLRLTPSTQGQ